MERLSMLDVTTVARPLSHTLHSAGLIRPGHELRIERGVASAGIPWRLWEVDPDRPTHNRPLHGPEVLGWTARGARDSLLLRNEVIRATLQTLRKAA